MPETKNQMQQVNGERYEAFPAGENIWLVKWYKQDGTLMETSVISGVADPAYVVRYAITRGDWA